MNQNQLGKILTEVLTARAATRHAQRCMEPMWRPWDRCSDDFRAAAIQQEREINGNGLPIPVEEIIALIRQRADDHMSDEYENPTLRAIGMVRADECNKLVDMLNELVEKES